MMNDRDVELAQLRQQLKQEQDKSASLAAKLAAEQDKSANLDKELFETSEAYRWLLHHSDTGQEMLRRQRMAEAGTPVPPTPPSGGPVQPLPPVQPQQMPTFDPNVRQPLATMAVNPADALQYQRFQRLEDRVAKLEEAMGPPRRMPS